MSSDALHAFRLAVDAAGESDRAAFARRARNAVAQAILAAAVSPEAAVAPPDHAPPATEVRELVGPELGDALAALYDGGADWTSRAIALLAPLNDAARR